MPAAIVAEHVKGGAVGKGREGKGREGRDWSGGIGRGKWQQVVAPSGNVAMFDKACCHDTPHPFHTPFCPICGASPSVPNQNF